jgi:hypothetical protein
LVRSPSASNLTEVMAYHMGTVIGNIQLMVHGVKRADHHVPEQISLENQS